jgi:hypothetical protein
MKNETNPKRMGLGKKISDEKRGNLNSHTYFLAACTLFLTGEARKGVRFLMRQSCCNPEVVI